MSMDSKKRKLGELPPSVKRTKFNAKDPPVKTKFLNTVIPRPDSRKKATKARDSARGCVPLSRDGAGGQQHNHQGGARPQLAVDKFIRTVIDGSVWHEECQSLMPALPKEAPLSFSSANEYIRTYEPLLREEARESLKANWVDACESGNCWVVKVVKVDYVGGGATKLEVDLVRNLAGMRDPPNSNCLVVLSNFCPPRKNPGEYLQNLLQGKAHRRGGVGCMNGIKEGGAESFGGKAAGRAGEGVGIMAGIVGPGNKEFQERVLIDSFPECPAHEGTSASPCKNIVSMLEDNKTQWYLVPVGSLITHLREHGALSNVKKLTFLKALLKPDKELAIPVDLLPRKLPMEVGVGLHEAMKKVYDGPQSDAIAMCTAHFATTPGTPSGQGHGHGNAKALPVMLIQGPPGTGKTHTVRGVLNLWHLVQFQRYYERVIGQYRSPSPEGPRQKAHGDWAGLVNLMKSGEMRTSMKPRILVCAPSNAATDELLERILKEGFFDASGKLYFPNVVRVGAEARTGTDVLRVSQGVRAVWVEEMVNSWMNMRGEEWDRRMHECGMKKRSLSEEISGIAQRMRMDSKIVDNLAGVLIANMEKHEKNDIELKRLEIVQPLLCGAHPGMVREAREKLELSFMDHAEMVFTTLSSTGKKVFSKVKRGFETVLIDEAAQACEVAALQPLVHGCNHCVLVGDPQQLPATVLSQKAKELNMERSLFERLQRAGAPVKVLTIQYRMHPQIRQFPSSHFYNGSLVDGQNIVNDSFHEFYNHSLLKPYVLFDVASGQHERQNSGSLQNPVEAEMAVSLFKELRDWLVKEAGKLRGERKPPLRSVRVGVVTPYKSQRKCLKDTFTRVLGERIAGEVKIATIDSFQGKQCDVIILSCVRASAKSSGVGFVADIRRMNVAITRAKRALWVLGNFRTLRANPSWVALIEDAEKRGCIIHNAIAKELFPHQPQFQRCLDEHDDKMEMDGEHKQEETGRDTNIKKHPGRHAKKNQKGGRGRGRGIQRGRGWSQASRCDQYRMQAIPQALDTIIGSQCLEKNALQDPRQSIIAPARAQPRIVVPVAGPIDPRKQAVAPEVTVVPTMKLHGEGTLMNPSALDNAIPPRQGQPIGSGGIVKVVAGVDPHNLTIPNPGNIFLGDPCGHQTYGVPNGQLDWFKDRSQVAALQAAIHLAQNGQSGPESRAVMSQRVTTDSSIPQQNDAIIGVIGGIATVPQQPGIDGTVIVHGSQTSNSSHVGFIHDISAPPRQQSNPKQGFLASANGLGEDWQLSRGL